MPDFTNLPFPGPEGRAAAIRASLNQIAALPGAADVDIGALQGAMELLSLPRTSDEDPALNARRKTCGEIASGIRISSPHNGGQWALPGDEQGARPWFQAQIDAWSDSADPRQQAMAKTAARELAELTSA